jgi:hypothetical protein
LNIGYIKGDIVNVVLLQLIEHQKYDLGIFSYDYVLYKKMIFKKIYICRYLLTAFLEYWSIKIIWIIFHSVSSSI